MAGRSLMAALGDAIAARVRDARERSEQTVAAAQQRARANIEARARAGDPAAIGLLGQLDAADAARAGGSAPARPVTPPAPSPVTALPGTIVPVAVAATLRVASPVRIDALSDGFRGAGLVRSIIVAEALAPPIALRPPPSP